MIEFPVSQTRGFLTFSFTLLRYKVERPVANFTTFILSSRLFKDPEHLVVKFSRISRNFTSFRESAKIRIWKDSAGITIYLIEAEEIEFSKSKYGSKVTEIFAWLITG